MDAFLNVFFYVFHAALVVFNTLGWIPVKTRRWNLVTLLTTAFSWFVLGIWYGWGYCFCTDWHWQVRERLGYTDHSTSYIHFLLLGLTGRDFDVKTVDVVTASVFFLSLVVSVTMNIRDWRKGRGNYGNQGNWKK